MLISVGKNCLGTAELVIRGVGMRKEQSFSVYPIESKESKDICNSIQLQSDTRFGKINIETGVMLLTRSRSNGSYGIHYAQDRLLGKLVETKFSEEDLEKIKDCVRSTFGVRVGDRGVVCDNGGVDKV